MGLHFVQVGKENPEHFESLIGLVVPYFNELDSHHVDSPHAPEDIIHKYTKSMIDKLGAADRFLELCYDGQHPVGFYSAKVDHNEDRGYKKPGYGFVMEFYIDPGYRRKGYGTEMFNRIKTKLYHNGADHIYLTTDRVTGKPFWISLGFISTGEISPDNGQEILEMRIIDNE